MAKSRKASAAGSSLRKKHGPKRHMFSYYKPMVYAMAKTGLLSKYINFESFTQACNAKGKKNVTRQDFAEFSLLTLDQKRYYFKSLTKNK